VVSGNPDRPGNGIVVTSIGWVTRVHGSKCPISNCVLTLTWSAAHGTMFFGFELEYSGS
jgi:hypothetical protein